jgi:hypothetical protein
MLLWLLITVTLIAVAVALNAGSGHGACTESWATVCIDPAAAHSTGPASNQTAANQAPHRRAVRAQQTSRP